MVKTFGNLYQNIVLIRFIFFFTIIRLCCNAMFLLQNWQNSCVPVLLKYCHTAEVSSFVQVIPKYLDVKNPQKCALVFNAKNVIRKKYRGHDKIFPSDPSLLATVIISYRITYDYEGPRCWVVNVLYLWPLAYHI